MKDEAGAPVPTLRSPAPHPQPRALSPALRPSHRSSHILHPTTLASLGLWDSLPLGHRSWPCFRSPGNPPPCQAPLPGPLPGGLCMSTLLFPSSGISALCVEETGAGSAWLMGGPLQTPQPPTLRTNTKKTCAQHLLWSRCMLKMSVAQSCPTLCDPVDCSPPGSSALGLLQARIPEWVACPSPGGSS